jgi:hypothetical protein
MRKGPEDGCWYAYCVRFCAVSEALRVPASRQKVAHYRRVAALPPKLGAALDERRAPFYVVRWIAWGKSSGTVKSRFDDVMRYLDVLRMWPPEPTLCPAISLGELVARLEPTLCPVRQDPGIDSGRR